MVLANLDAINIEAEPAAVRSDVGFSPHHHAPAAIFFGQLRHRDNDTRCRAKRQATGYSLDRITPGRPFAEMRDSQHGAVMTIGKVRKRL